MMNYLLQKCWPQEKICTETAFMLEKKNQINRQPEQH